MSSEQKSTEIQTTDARENQTQNHGWKRQKYWYLGLLGFVGIYKLPVLWAVISGDGSLLDGLNVLWFLWFGYFLPEEREQGDK